MFKKQTKKGIFQIVQESLKNQQTRYNNPKSKIPKAAVLIQVIQFNFIKEQK
jgi:hypothetical protein